MRVIYTCKKFIYLSGRACGLKKPKHFILGGKYSNVEKSYLMQGVLIQILKNDPRLWGRIPAINVRRFIDTSSKELLSKDWKTSMGQEAFSVVTDDFKQACVGRQPQTENRFLLRLTFP